MFSVELCYFRIAWLVVWWCAAAWVFIAGSLFLVAAAPPWSVDVASVRHGGRVRQMSLCQHRSVVAIVVHIIVCTGVRCLL